MKVDLPRNSGKLIAIEGIDQSGKRTQTQLLAKKLRMSGYAVSMYSFPDYNTRLGRQLKAYLKRRSRLDFHAVHLLYTANKWEKAADIIREINRTRVVIVNRYSPSNLAYGVAHGLPLDWLSSLEKDLPKPNQVFVLDIKPRTSYTRKKRRRDLHEEDLPYLSRVRKAYIQLATKYQWKIIDGARDKTTVHLDLWGQVSRILKD